MTAITATTPIPAGTTWTVDPVHSTVGFAVKHMVVSTFRGRFEDYDATLTANEDGTLRLEGRVAADSIAVKDENLAAHLKAPDFFDTERHPYVPSPRRWSAPRTATLIVDGELTIKGHTRPIEARGMITEPHVTFGDVEKVGLELEAIVDRTEYGLDWNAPLPKGGFALANEVKLLVNLELAQGVVPMKVLGLSGSLRAGSHNSKLLRAAGDLLPREAELVEFDGLKLIPPFDEDDEHTRPERCRRSSTRSPTPTPSWSPPPSTTTRSRASSRTRSTGSPGRWPSRPLRNKPAAVVGASTGLFGAVWAQAEARKVLSAIGARVIDRELPIGMADDAFTPDGTLVDEDLSLALGRHPRRAPRRDPPSSPNALKGPDPLGSFRFAAPLAQACGASSVPKALRGQTPLGGL